jgi:hypothetical protein
MVKRRYWEELLWEQSIIAVCRRTHPGGDSVVPWSVALSFVAAFIFGLLAAHQLIRSPRSAISITAAGALIATGCYLVGHGMAAGAETVAQGLPWLRNFQWGGTVAPALWYWLTLLLLLREDHRAVSLYGRVVGYPLGITLAVVSAVLTAGIYFDDWLYGWTQVSPPFPERWAYLPFTLPRGPLYPGLIAFVVAATVGALGNILLSWRPAINPAALADQAAAAPAWAWRAVRGVGLRSIVAVRRQALVGAELLIIVLWTLVITAPYLNFDETAVPIGREYLSAILSHHVWIRALECGWCALWNGSVAGGFPAFADVHGSMLYPPVIVTTLLFGVLNGSKLMLVLAFGMCGLAQWWLARVLELGPVARVWSACMAVAAGRMAGALQLGFFGVAISIAACALVLPPLIATIRTGSRRSAVLLGAALGLAALAGQGYLQIGLMFTLPAALIGLVGRPNFGLLARRLGLAVLLAFLIAAPFVVPFGHFLPQFAKHVDPNFTSTQPFAFVPLNLVIDDPSFYLNDALKKLPFPAHHVNFIGWIPVLLALWGLTLGRNGDERRTIALLAALVVLPLWIASAGPLAWLAHNVPITWLAEQFAGIRVPSYIAVLAIPPLLALAALALDRLVVATAGWATVAVSRRDIASRPVLIDLRWLLVIPLLAALANARSFGTNWIYTQQLIPEIPRLVESLRTPDLQWVEAPFGEQAYMERAINMGLKLSYGYQTWLWRGRPPPEPVMQAIRVGEPTDMTRVGVAGGVPLYVALPGREYAAVTLDDGSRAICSARGIGGNIDVSCATRQSGVLTVKENMWSGWKVWIDGHPAALEPGRWLAVNVPAGSRTIQFRYQPWDVPLGLLLCALGVGLAWHQWLKGDHSERQSVPSP